MDMAIYLLSGTCFGDIYPINNGEIAISIIFMVYGFLLYGKIFGDLEHVLVLLKDEKAQKEYSF